MPRSCAGLAAVCLLLCRLSSLAAEERAKSVEQIAEAARPSVVVVITVGRDGKPNGLGTGFVVASDGLIATNLHVIGDARPITVELADGKHYDVTAVHATDRSSDLAVVRIDAKGLVPLPLGDSDALKDGQTVVALGNPQGLKHSVVAGVVSGVREVEGRRMIQLAIPIEPGNSGGPLLDLHGRVVGIPSIKSLVTANLGFGVPVNALKPLLRKPNPVPMARWLTIGALNPKEWAVLFGAHWRQRAGHILVEGLGAGFGGRSLCLSQHAVPAPPYELAVTVRLDDEAGAAGLAFHADGGNKHYGFYPTNGRLRLTRFDGPDVLSWKILADERSKHYHPSEWNTLKVRVEKDRLLCYVNDQLVIESTDTGLSAGKVGLVKFRDTRAEFKNFQVARQIPTQALSPEQVARVTRLIKDLPPGGTVKPELLNSLASDASASVEVLRDRARQLERQAIRLRELAQSVHQRQVQTELNRVLQGKEEDIDLVHAALLIARLDNEELDVAAYRKEIEGMARELADSLPRGADEKAKLAALNKYLFTDRGFHGSRADYYHRSNSYLNEVLDDREGIPITLSVVYLELARRIGLKVEGVGMPGHFIVRHVAAKGESQLIDVFEGGQPMTRAEADRRVQAVTDQPLQDSDLAATRKRAIIVRMLQNLLGIAREGGDGPGMLRYLDTILAISADAAPERWLRALLRFGADDRAGALEDVDWLLKHEPEGMDLERVRDLRRALVQPER